MTTPIVPHRANGASQVIQGFFPNGKPRIIQATPVPAPAPPPAASFLAPVQRKPAPLVPPPLHPGAAQPTRAGLHQPILPKTARPGGLPQTPPNRLLPPPPILPKAAGPGPLAPPIASARPAVPQPILPKTTGPAAAVQPSTGHAFALPPGFALKPSSLGQKLPEAVQRQMEAFFKSSFSEVRVHIGPEPASIGALAFTHGNDLYFAPGQYNPQTPNGQRLLGHELTHVVQQRAGRVRNPLGAGVAVVQDPAMESEAERMGIAASRSVVQRAVTLQQLIEKFAETNGDFSGTIGEDTFEHANEVGEQWVGGAAATLNFYGASAWDARVNATTGCQYRPPMLKKSGKKADSFQANYEAKKRPEATKYTFNAHVTITNLNAETFAAKRKDYAAVHLEKKQAESKDKPSGSGSDDEGSNELAF
jgi:hypothetical protein